MQPVQLVKLVVIGLGLLIIVGLGLLVYGVTSRVADPEFRVSKERGAGPVAPSALVPAFGEMRVPLPDGCTVVEMVPDGDRLYLRTGPAGTCERILIIEAGSGRALGTLLLRP
ncbi:MAG: hypothetical protein MUE49_01390 [Rhodospirillales bacterium]|jgi:hypothetical protein|nr:hypothetical protein [Rhodospirillales bacterium]